MNLAGSPGKVLEPPLMDTAVDGTKALHHNHANTRE